MCRKTRNAYKHRRDLLVNGCKSIGWDIDMPKGTMFAWAKIPDKFKDSETFVKELFDKTGVLVVPGNALVLKVKVMYVWLLYKVMIQ